MTRSRADFSFNYHRARAQHVNVTLVKLTKTSARRPICAPHRLNLITFEKLRQLVSVLGDESRQRNSQIVTKGEIGFTGRFMNAPFEDFEDELIALFTILSQQRFYVFNRRRLERFEAVPFVDLLDDADDILATPHVGGQEIAHTARGLRLR